MKRNKRRADRVRAAICVALDDADEPLTIRQLVEAVAALGIPLGQQPNKTVADAIRWEVERKHVRKLSRGVYVAAHLPESTIHYMRVRVLTYPDQSYERPYTRVFVEDPPPIVTKDPNQLQLFV